MRIPTRPIVILSMVACACVSDDLWRVSDQPTAADVEIVLSETDPASIRREYSPSEVPAIPVRESYGPVITQRDFPALVAEVRRQNRADFGESADRPD